jgi:hypothetical protein
MVIVMLEGMPRNFSPVVNQLRVYNETSCLVVKDRLLDYNNRLGKSNTSFNREPLYVNKDPLYRSPVKRRKIGNETLDDSLLDNEVKSQVDNRCNYCNIVGHSEEWCWHRKQESDLGNIRELNLALENVLMQITEYYGLEPTRNKLKQFRKFQGLQKRKYEIEKKIRHVEIERLNIISRKNEVDRNSEGPQTRIEIEGAYPARVYAHVMRDHFLSLRCKICQINDRTWDATSKAELEEHVRTVHGRPTWEDRNGGEQPRKRRVEHTDGETEPRSRHEKLRRFKQQQRETYGRS